MTLLRRAWAHPTGGPVLRLVLAYLVFIEIGVQLLFGRIDVGFLDVGRRSAPVPHGVFVNGAVVGCLYSLVAIGLILVYRANRVINFAQASLGAVPALLALVLMSRRGLPYVVAIPIVLVGGALLGGAVETGIVRRFKSAPRLILTVATIGIGQLLAFIEFWTPKWVSGEVLPPTNFPTPLRRFSFEVGIVRFTGDHLLTVIVVGVLVAGLGAFFRYTDIGIAVRASAENANRAALLGIPVARVSTVVWVIAATLSAVGVFLRGPLVGLPVGGLTGPAVLLFGLAAAVIARMEKLAVAFVAGMALGIVDQSAVFSTRRPTLAYAIMLAVIVGALLLQRGAAGRAHDTGVATWQMVKEFRPVPTELRGLREVALGKGILGVLVAAIVLGAPMLVGDERLGLATLVVIYAMVGVSLVVLTGWAGQISLGQFAFAGVGAAVAGGLAANHDWDFFMTLWVAGLAGAAIAVLIGLPALRIQGLLLAVTTLAFAFTVENFVLNPEFFGWLLPEDLAFVERPILYGRFSIESDMRFYYACLVFLGLSVLAARSLRRLRSGRVLIGVRDNTRALQAFGVNPARTRLAAFAISGFIAAIAGALLAYQQGTVDAATYSPTTSIQLFTMTVIGGLTSLPGALLGAAYVVGVPYLLQDHVENIGLLSTGIGLLVLLLFVPGGLSEVAYRGRDRFLRALARRHGVHVPSLVADSRVGP